MFMGDAIAVAAAVYGNVYMSFFLDDEWKHIFMFSMQAKSVFSRKKRKQKKKITNSENEKSERESIRLL